MTTKAKNNGVARLATIPVRAAPSDRAEMVTQLLFGDYYTVSDTDETKKWLKITVHFDAYQGWIDARQHHAIPNTDFNSIADHKISTDIVSDMVWEAQAIKIVIGSVLQYPAGDTPQVPQKATFHGQAKPLERKGDTNFLKQIAANYLNAPYLWGGRSPFGIDCSGFTQIVYKINGYKLPRDARQQATAGRAITFENRQVGDLAFFENRAGQITHTGILWNKEEIIHASGKVRIDLLKADGIYTKDANLKTHELKSIRRIM